MNQPRYYAGEFDNDRKINGAFLLVLLILAATITHGVMLWCGIRIGRAAAYEEQRLAASQPKPTPAVVKADWSQFNCHELQAICWNRAKRKLTEAAR